jgi:hypothetical protein
MSRYDSTRPGVGRTKPCPYCAGRGSVSAERDTLRMTREQMDAMRTESETLKTPKLPPPAPFDVPLVHIPKYPPFTTDEETTPITTPVRIVKHDLPAIILALLVTTVFLWGVALIFFDSAN